MYSVLPNEPRNRCRYAASSGIYVAPVPFIPPVNQVPILPQQLIPLLLPPPIAIHGQLINNKFVPSVDLSMPGVPREFLEFLREDHNRNQMALQQPPIFFQQEQHPISQPAMVPQFAAPEPLSMAPAMVPNFSNASAELPAMTYDVYSTNGSPLTLPCPPSPNMFSTFVFPQPSLNMSNLGPVYSNDANSFVQQPQSLHVQQPQSVYSSVQNYQVPHYGTQVPDRQCLSKEEANEVALEPIFAEEARNAAYCEFLDKGPTLMDAAQRKSKREGRKWLNREFKAVDLLKNRLLKDFEHWAAKGNLTLLQTWIDIVHEMAKLIEFEATKSLGRRKICERANLFRKKTLNYLTQEGFNTKDAVDFAFDKTRSLKIFTRLFKNLQMMRFPHFHLTLSNPEMNNGEADKSLRGRRVIRNRCKRMESFRPEAHLFDKFIYELIKKGDSGVDNMYICRDHKPLHPKKKNKPRVVAGLLFYFVCESDEAAEKLLRKFVQFCESGETPEQQKIYQDMFRKAQSKTAGVEDKLKRDRLCLEVPWGKVEFDNQKKMYHFTLALPGLKKEDPAKVTSNKPVRKRSPSPSLATIVSPSKPTARKPTLEFGIGCMGN